jgi:hypothetical protein
MTREEIVRELQTRTNFAIADGNTFIWAKSNRDFDAALHRSEALGGGNFYVLMASFSTLSLLAQINALLDAEPTYSEVEVTTIRNAVRPLDAEIKKALKLPQVGNFKKTEKELVETLVAETADRTQIDTSKFINLWSVRHKLFHTFNPGPMPAASYERAPGTNYVDRVNEANASGIFCMSTDGRESFDVHAFNHKLRIFADYVVNKLNAASTELVQEVSMWLESN